MGDGSNSARCERFIKEFESDAVRQFAPTSSGILGAFRRFYLGFDENSFEVHLFGLLDDAQEAESHEVMFTDVLFNVFLDPEELVESVCSLFGLDEKVARERLKRAELL